LSFSVSDLGVAAPELVLAGSSLALLLFGAYAGERSARAVTQMAVFALVAALVMVAGGSHATVTAFHGLFRADAFAAIMKALAIIASGLTLLLGYDSLERDNISRSEYPVLVLLSTLGMMMMVSANDLMSLYMGLELQSLALYVMAAINRDNVRSTEAGLKYFVLGALSSGMLLYGASLIYGFAGTTNFDAIAALFKAGQVAPVGVVVGIVFLMAGLAFKVSAVPFHMWTPDVYEGAPTPVTAFLSAAPKVAAIALFLRVLVGPFGGLVSEWQQVIVFISIASMAVGAFAAIQQTNIKRLMAYSSIGHMGYALIGLATASPKGVSGVVVYMAIYIAMGLGTFACIVSMRRDGKSVETIADLAGLSRTKPLMALMLAIFMFSMAGIPPLAGFFGKLYIFLAAIEAKMVTLAILGVLASVVGTFYYLRIIKIMYFDEPAEAMEPMGATAAAVCGVTALFTVGFFLYPAPVVNGASLAASALFGG